jgi:hypothetical protein
MMLARGRPIRSHLSGGTATTMSESDMEVSQDTPDGFRPAAHGLLVALVSAPGNQPIEPVIWPLWLVPRVSRLRSSRIHSHENGTASRD